MQNFETYGKAPYFERTKNEIVYRFKKNNHTSNLLQSKGLDQYIPKLNKLRFGLGVLGASVCIATPFITPLSVFPLLWGIK